MQLLAYQSKLVNQPLHCLRNSTQKIVFNKLFEHGKVILSSRLSYFSSQIAIKSCGLWSCNLLSNSRQILIFCWSKCYCPHQRNLSVATFSSPTTKPRKSHLNKSRKQPFLVSGKCERYKNMQKSANNWKVVKFTSLPLAKVNKPV